MDLPQFRMMLKSLNDLPLEKEIEGATAYSFLPYNRHHGLLSLANILHRVDRSNDAANVLEESLQISPGNPLTHFALGNIYAALKDFQRFASSHVAL